MTNSLGQGPEKNNVPTPGYFQSMNQKQIDTAEKILVTSATWLSRVISFTLKFFFWATMIMIGFLVSVIWGVLKNN
jgi:hypothetical protein